MRAGAEPESNASLESDDQPRDQQADRARVAALRAFAEGARTLPVLIQTEPDPDAIGSAYAVRVLLDRTDKNCPIVSLGHSRRPETKRMIELLDLAVTEITEAELRSFERVIAVDLEPTMLEGAETRLAVIDHHPPESGYDAEFADVRTEYGATATMLTEYLRADGTAVGPRLATALLYGIRTDTALLTRGCTRNDVEAYAYLQERADMALLNKVDRPAYPRNSLKSIGNALARTRLCDELAVLWLGNVLKSESHMMSELADLSLNIEGVRWSAAAGVIDGALVVNVRHIAESEPGAGDLASLLAGEGGSGGGHATMARAEIPLDQLDIDLAEEDEGDPGVENGQLVADWIDTKLDEVRVAPVASAE